jgi:hypothetical protein
MLIRDHGRASKQIGDKVTNRLDKLAAKMHALELCGDPPDDTTPSDAPISAK